MQMLDVKSQTTEAHVDARTSPGPASSAKKRDRVRGQTSIDPRNKEPIQVSEEDSPQSHKKAKQGKESRRRHQSPKISLDGLNRADFEQYVEDPFNAYAKVCKFGLDLLKKWRKEDDERVAGNILEAKISWL